jgi:hypothetical protein
MSFHRSRQRDSKAVESFGGSHRSMSELIGVLVTGLTAGVYLYHSACAGRGHAHKLEREHSQKPPLPQGDYRGKGARADGVRRGALTKLRPPDRAPAGGAGRQSRNRHLVGARPKRAARRPGGRQTWLEATGLKCRWPAGQAGSRPRDRAVLPTRSVGNDDHLGNKVLRV